MFSLEKLLRRSTANYIHKIDGVLKEKQGQDKTETLIALKKEISGKYKGKTFSEGAAAVVLLSAAALLGIVAILSVAQPFVLAGLAAVALFGVGVYANRVGNIRMCRKHLESKIDNEIATQLASENYPDSSLQGMQNKTLKEQFKFNASAEVRFEALRQKTAFVPASVPKP